MLMELKHVSVNNNEQFSSSEPLRGLRKLLSAAISHVDTVDLDVFTGMQEFKELSLVSVENADFNILAKQQLEYLEITCDDDTFQTVKQLKSLKTLRLFGDGEFDGETGQFHGGLTNVDGIEELTNLGNLYLSAPNCRDISATASLKLEK